MLEYSKNLEINFQEINFKERYEENGFNYQNVNNFITERLIQMQFRAYYNLLMKTSLIILAYIKMLDD